MAVSECVICVGACQSFIFLHVIGRELKGAVVVVPASLEESVLA